MVTCFASFSSFVHTFQKQNMPVSIRLALILEMVLFKYGESKQKF